MKKTKVNTLLELLQAISENIPQVLEIEASILSPHSITVPEGYQLTGKSNESCMVSFNNSDGFGVTRDNTISNLTVMTKQTNRAIYTVCGIRDMGNIDLENLKITGQVSIISRQGTDKINFIANNIHITSCDSRHYSEQPQKYGVNVYQGALTVYNFNSDENSRIYCELTNISLGFINAPVIGSGIFVCGFGDKGGKVYLETLTTDAVYSNGMLPFGTADIITAAVFIVYGVEAKTIEHHGELVTYGVNDMVLDTWGKVEKWVSNDSIVSYGPSGIGFVNFGTVKDFMAQDITTYGVGARGFNQYDGTVENITFKSITTHGDGSIGIQVSKPIGHMTVKENVTTYGAVGNSLVKGVLTELAANAISIKSGGKIENLTIHGDIVTYGDNVTNYALEGGEVANFNIDGEMIVHGENSQPQRTEE
ncbi:hypothetical protein [Peribacillus huizhouensis]|uniref:Right handed beta helix domain-containing protein n=1 Tax=Peribacillus huizhouensis TaxID=1501239 RepID=A0ABR6CTM8_9BACI|nr:hypothetical protein [Peribacillus huizhouensis]MBA9028379.1 hypothetical protein [Peribacillus huizhouensis]